MGSLDSIITLNISRSAAAVSRQGFGVALILGPNASGWGSDRIRTYTSPSALLQDGFTTSHEEYKQAVALYAQEVKPTKFKVGKTAATPAAQVTTITPNVATQAVQDYTVTIDGEEFTFTSDATPTAAEVVTGLTSIINASTQPLTASGTNTLILTADEAGVGFTIAVTANLSAAATVANAGVGTDLAAIKAIDNDWYALILCDGAAATIMGAAAWIESERKIYVASNADAAVIAAGTTDIASRLKAKSYTRTAFIYSANHGSGTEGAALGNVLPRVPGAWTIKFKSLVGITADALTDTQFTVAKSKNANVYTTVAGAGMLEEGIVASGEFLDVIVGIDWIHANMQADAFQALRDEPKIPYTNAGAGVIESIIRNRLQLAITNGILAADPSPVIVVPLVADQDPADKAVRRLAGITFAATLAGAVHATTINGYVSV